MLSLPTLARLLLELSQRHFYEIAGDSSHPLFSRIIFNNCRMSSRNNTLYRQQRFWTQKRAKSFLHFFFVLGQQVIYMYKHLYMFLSYFIICIFIYVRIQYYRSSDTGCPIK